MTQENPQAQILYTHFNRAFERDNAYCDDSEVISYQMRLVGVELIRLIQIGKLQPREDVLQNLADINEGLQRHGKPPLEFDFRSVL